MTSRIFDTITPTWLLDPTALTQTTEYGLDFSLYTDLYLTELSWYRPVAGSGNPPVRLRLWDATALATVYDTASIPDNNAVGWQRHFLGVAILLSAGQHYRVSAVWQSGTKETYANSGSGSPGTHIALPGTYNFYVHGLAFPNTSPVGTTWEGIDVGVDADPPSGSTPPNPGTTANAELANWFITTGDNQHQSDGLPWRTDANVTTVKSEAEGANGFAAIKAVADAVATAVSGLPGTIASAVTTVTGQLTTMTGNTAQTAIATIGAISHDLQNVLIHGEDVLAGNVTFPGSSTSFAWSSIGSTSFVGELLYAQEADAYVLTVTTLPVGKAITLVDGVHVVYRAGWWCECISGHGSERHFVDFETTILRDGARRLGGVLVQLGPGGEGTIEAFNLAHV